MAVPVNTHDFGRFKALADLIKTEGTKSELRIYVSSSDPGEEDQKYVSLEITGRVPADQVASIFND